MATQKVAEPVATDSEDQLPEEDDDKALVLAGIAESDGEEEMPDESAAFQEGQDVGKIPKAASTVVEKTKAQKGNSEETGIVYVGRKFHPSTASRTLKARPEGCLHTTSSLPLAAGPYSIMHPFMSCKEGILLIANV